MFFLEVTFFLNLDFSSSCSVFSVCSVLFGFDFGENVDFIIFFHFHSKHSSFYFFVDLIYFLDLCFVLFSYMYVYIYVYLGCIFPLDCFPLFPIISFSFMLFFFALAFHFVPLLVCLLFRLCNFFRLWLLSAAGTERNDIQWTGPQGPLFQCSENAPRTQADLIISRSLIAVWLPLEEGLFSFSHHREVGSRHWIRENLNDIRQLKYFLNNGSTSWLYKLRMYSYYCWTPQELYWALRKALSQERRCAKESI